MPWSSWSTLDSGLVALAFGALLAFDIATPYLFEKTLYHHFVALGMMLFFSLAYNAAVWVTRGEKDAIAWCTGYVVEWALSLDNLFVFHLVFKTFSVPHSQAGFALTVGIYGAVVLRVVFILGLSALFSVSFLVYVVVGVLLIISGISTVQDDGDEDVSQLYTVRFFKWLLGGRLKDGYDPEGRLWVREPKGGWQATVLMLVICIIMVIDVFFAVDSVGSTTGQIRDVYLNISAALMSMFSLRALFFVIRDLADYFELLKYGICLILCVVGMEMIIKKWVSIPIAVMCVLIATIFLSSVILSVIKAELDTTGHDEPEQPTAGEVRL